MCVGVVGGGGKLYVLCISLNRHIINQAHRKCTIQDDTQQMGNLGRFKQYFILGVKATLYTSALLYKLHAHISLIKCHSGSVDLGTELVTIFSFSVHTVT